MNKIALLLIVILISTSSFSQEASDPPSSLAKVDVYQKLELNNLKSDFIIKGTSSLHDWEMVSSSFSGSLVYKDISSADLEIQSIAVDVSVKSLESGKNIMDRKCYDALKGDDHPNIKYRFKKVESFEAISDNEYEAKLSGSLTIAGKTKTVNINVKIRVENDKVIIKGEKALKMTDYDVTPPKALLGTLKTGNDIIIDFNLNYY